MTAIPKIRLFLILLYLAAFVCSCNRKNDVIPDTYVSFEIDLYDPEFVELLSIGGSVYVDASTNNFGSRAAGFAGNGIIITQGPANEFYAYDRTCPHDYSENGQAIRVNLDQTYFTMANCPECGSFFELMAAGTPVDSAISRYPLKNYRTILNGSHVFVSNY